MVKALKWIPIVGVLAMAWEIIFSDHKVDRLGILDSNFTYIGSGIVQIGSMVIICGILQNM